MQPETRGFKAKRVCTAIAVLAAAGCRSQPAANVPPSVVSLETVLSDVYKRPVASSAGDSLVVIAGALVNSRSVFIVDVGLPGLSAVERTGGSMQLIAREGDNLGDVRHPISIAPMDSGRFAVLDIGRHLLSVRDSTGAVLREFEPPHGNYASMIGLPAEHRLMLSGNVRASGSSNPSSDLNEFDYAGRIVDSLPPSPILKSRWQRAFAAMSIASVGDLVFSVSLNTNRVRLIDRANHRIRWQEVGAGWFPPLDWPSDATLQRVPGAETAAERVREWTRSHRLANGIFALTGGRFIVRFQAFDSKGARFFYYALADTAGSTRWVTYPTRDQVVASRGDTLFWLAVSDAHHAEFGSGVVSDRDAALEHTK